MKKGLQYIVCVLLLSACGGHEQKKIASLPAALKKSSLPFEIRPCSIQPPGLPDLDPDQSGEFPGFVPYCELEGNENFRIVVFVSVADCATPMIVTYNNDGKSISSEVPGTKHCDSDFNLRCVSYIKIAKDLSILSCDSAYVQITDSCEVGEINDFYIKREGRIDADGKITFEKPVRVELK